MHRKHNIPKQDDDSKFKSILNVYLSVVPSSGEQANAHFRNLLVSIWNVNIKVAVAKCLLKHYFDAEYTIRQLPTANQHAKDGFCGKNTGRETRVS